MNSQNVIKKNYRDWIKNDWMVQTVQKMFWLHQVWSSPEKHTHTHTHTHTRKHKHKHTQTHTNTHIHTWVKVVTYSIYCACVAWWEVTSQCLWLVKVLLSVTLVLKSRFMTPLERRSLVRSDGRHIEALLLSRLDRADSTSSLPLATDKDRPEDSMWN